MTTHKRTTGLLVRSGNAMRIFLINISLFIMAGIWLTGFETVHWFSYVIPAILTTSAIFGICPGINLWRMVLGENN